MYLLCYFQTGQDKQWKASTNQRQRSRKLLFERVAKSSIKIINMTASDKIIIPGPYPHSIEWGEATWDKTDFSIRNRYDSTSGRFNKAGSSEIPWADFIQMIIESIRRNHFTNAQIGDITKAVADYISTKK
jgi:hypothetical protein